MAIDVYDGKTYGGKVSFDYQGPGGTFKVGFGLNIAGTGIWATKLVDLPYTAITARYTVNVEGIYNSYGNLGVCRLIDTMKIIGEPYGTMDIGGKGFIIADPDRDVYHHTEPGAGAFDNLRVDYY